MDNNIKLANLLTQAKAETRAIELAIEFMPSFNPAGSMPDDKRGLRFALGATDVLTMNAACPKEYTTCAVDQLEDLAVLHGLKLVYEMEKSYPEGGL